MTKVENDVRYKSGNEEGRDLWRFNVTRFGWTMLNTLQRPWRTYLNGSPVLKFVRGSHRKVEYSKKITKSTHSCQNKHRILDTLTEKKYNKVFL